MSCGYSEYKGDIGRRDDGGYQDQLRCILLGYGTIYADHEEVSVLIALFCASCGTSSSLYFVIIRTIDSRAHYSVLCDSSSLFAFLFRFFVRNSLEWVTYFGPESILILA
jgi:hypothetical protein